MAVRKLVGKELMDAKSLRHDFCRLPGVNATEVENLITVSFDGSDLLLHDAWGILSDFYWGDSDKRLCESLGCSAFTTLTLALQEARAGCDPSVIKAQTVDGAEVELSAERKDVRDGLATKLVLVYGQGLDPEDAAKIVGILTATVYRRNQPIWQRELDALWR